MIQRNERMRYRPRVAIVGFVSLLVGGACGDPNQDVAPSTASAVSNITTAAPVVETFRFAVPDGSIVEVAAPEGVIAPGASTHTEVSLERLVLLVETGARSFGEGLVAEMTEPETEPYRGGELTSGQMTTGPEALVWLGDSYSLFLPYDSVIYRYEDVRELLDAMEFVEGADGIIARPGRVKTHRISVSVSLTGGGGLDIEPIVGPDQKDTKVDRGPSNEVISIVVAYPSANVIVYVPPFRDGAAFVELMELIEIDWS